MKHFWTVAPLKNVLKYFIMDRGPMKKTLKTHDVKCWGPCKTGTLEKFTISDTISKSRSHWKKVIKISMVLDLGSLKKKTQNFWLGGP